MSEPQVEIFRCYEPNDWLEVDRRKAELRDKNIRVIETVEYDSGESYDEVTLDIYN